MATEAARRSIASANASNLPQAYDGDALLREQVIWPFAGYRDLTKMHAHRWSSSPRESHPQALTQPDVNL